jgi:DHA1 family multidrug resistance protein-like MFS transporter
MIWLVFGREVILLYISALLPKLCLLAGDGMLGQFKDDLMVLSKYSQLFPLCFAVFVSMLGFGLVMPLLPIYARNFGASGLQLGFLTSSFAVARLITTLPGGWLADNLGRKKPVVLGLLVYSVVMSLYGFSQDVFQLILFRAFQGMASGIVWPVISTMVADMVSPRDRGKALGIYEMTWFLGTVVGPGLGGVLAGTFSISVPFFVCGAFTVQETVTVEQARGNLEVNANPLPTKNHEPAGLASFVHRVGQLTPYVGPFLGLCIARFILAFSNSLIQPLLSVFANEELGIPEAGVGILFAVQGFATLLATMPMGTVGDKVGRKPMVVLGQVFDAASAILIVFSGSFWPLVLIMTLRGLGRAVSNPSIIAMFSGLLPLSKRGRGMGVFSVFQNVGLVAGATVGGFLYEYSSSEMPFVACALLGVAGVLIVLATVSEPKQGLK